LLEVAKGHRGNFDAVELRLIFVEAPDLKSCVSILGGEYLEVLRYFRVDAGFKLDFGEVGGGHIEQFVQTADMLVEGHTYSHLFKL